MKLFWIPLFLMACVAPETKNGICLDVPKTACDRALECGIIQDTEITRKYCRPCAAYYLAAVEIDYGVSKFDLDNLVETVRCNEFVDNPAFAEVLYCVTGDLETVEVE